MVESGAPERGGRLERIFQGGLSAIVRGSARAAPLVVLIVALLTAGAFAVLVKVEPNVETDIQAGYFATYDDQANAFRQLRRDVAGVNSEIVFFELREGARGHNPASGAIEPVDNVTDVPALLAQEELFQFVKAEFRHRAPGNQDKVLSHTSLPYFFKLIYAQFPHGGYEVPTDPADHRLAAQLVISAGGPSINLYHSNDTGKAPEARWDAAVMFLIYDPDTSLLSKKETGGLINEIIADYRAMSVGECGASGACKSYDLWKQEYFDSWGVQSWIYRIDEQVSKEAVLFTAAVFLVIAIALFLLLRSVKRALIGVTTLFIILVWTLAGMTLGGVAIGFISMAMFPLILGVGSDYVIHIMNEFAQERGQAKSALHAFDQVGRRGAMALWIATITTIAGFVVIIFSTSPMIVEICWATIGGMTGVYLLSITFVPAMLRLTLPDETREVSRPSELMGRLGSAIGRNKWGAVAILVVGTLFFVSQIPRVEYVIGTVEVNLPSKELWTHDEDRAHMLDMYERFQGEIKATGQETVITIGDGPGSLATRAAVDDMIALHQAMVADPFVQAAGGAVNSVPFILNLYAILKDGIETAGPAIANDQVCPNLPPTPPLPPRVQDQLPVPVCPQGTGPQYDPTFAHIQDWDDADIKAAYADMLRRPEFSPLLLTFMDANASIAWALTFVNIPIDQEATDKADDAFSAVVQATPEGGATRDYYFGTLTGIKKYNDYTDFWLTLANIVSTIVVLFLVLLFTRSWRTVGAVSVPLVLTFVWWLGVLPVLDIDLAFVYLIPTSFITSIGSDYAVHLAYNMHLGTPPRDVFRTVGKGVAFSSVTTLCSFLIFSRGAIRGSYEMFVACVAAIVIITVTTFLAIPLFYKWGRGRGSTAQPTGTQRL